VSSLQKPSRRLAVHELQIRNWRGINVSALAGASRTAVRDAFKCTRGTVLPAGERDMQETPRKGSDTKERILDLAEASRRASRPLSSAALRRAGCLSPVG
jgi:hypothetical protein